MSKPLVIFVSYGSFGDINPLLVIAQQLTMSCRVQFITNEYYRQHIENAGVPFHAIGSIQEHTGSVDTINLSSKTMTGLMAQFHIHVGSNIGRLADYFRQLRQQGESLLVVIHALTNPAMPICEQLNIPVVRAHVAPSYLPLLRQDFLLEQVVNGYSTWRARLQYPLHALKIRISGHEYARKAYNQYRVEANIEPAYKPYQQWFRKLLGRSSLRLNVIAELMLTPQWFAEPIDGALKTMQCVGFPRFPESPPNTIAALDEFINQYGPPIVITPGTGVGDLAQLCDPFESICMKLNAPGIVLSRHGHAQFKEMQRTLNHPIIHVDYLEYPALAWLLTRTKLFIHPGGIGTIVLGIASAVPQIICPTYYDQPRNAVRMAILGLAGIVNPHGYSSDAVVNVYHQLIASDYHRECRNHYAAQVQQEDGASNAATAIATIVAGLEQT